MSDQVASVFVTADVVIPRLSPSGSEWEVALIQRKNQPYRGAWALPGGHLDTEDTSLEAAAQRETREETGLNIPLHLFQQVQAYEDFEDPRGKYICLLYVLSEPLSSQTQIEAGDDASLVQWHSVENLQKLPSLAFNHIRLLTVALRHFFTAYYHHVGATGNRCLPMRDRNCFWYALFKYSLLAIQWHGYLSKRYTVRISLLPVRSCKKYSPQ